ncbi:multidrug efflux pump VmrA [Mobiluncus mulieris]|nr:multidrug transporter [Mobiluncus mulieris]STY85295.1 multidrug efflux pump VmrA [Mobiluncus mulieris]
MNTKRRGNQPGEDESGAKGSVEYVDKTANGKSLNRRILGLAVPSLGSLLAEPLMVLADSAMIGHLGTTELAGLTLASSVNVLVAGLCLFLVYGTTAVASRQLGAGDRAAAVTIWLITKNRRLKAAEAGDNSSKMSDGSTVADNGDVNFTLKAGGKTGEYLWEYTIIQ